MALDGLCAWVLVFLQCVALAVCASNCVQLGAGAVMIMTGSDGGEGVNARMQHVMNTLCIMVCSCGAL
jgi:hypothetical protein